MHADIIHDETATVVATVTRTKARVVVRGTRVVFGLVPIRPLADMPAGVVKYWIRQSADGITTLVLKFGDRVERWIVEVRGEGEAETWTPAFLQARFSLPARLPVSSPAPAPDQPA